MNNAHMNFTIGGDVTILPFLASPTSVYSNARIIRPHLEVRYYRGIDLLTTDQLMIEHAHQVPQLQKDIPNFAETQFWIVFSVNPLVPRTLFKTGRRTFVILPLTLRMLNIDGKDIDASHFNTDQINGSIEISYANLFPRNYELIMKVKMNHLTPNSDKDARADFYLSVLPHMLDQFEVLRTMPADLLQSRQVRQRVFENIHKLMDLLHINVDTPIFEQFVEYLRLPNSDRVAGTRGEEIQAELDSVTKEIMEMQRKKDAGLWTEEDEAYIKSL